MEVFECHITGLVALVPFPVAGKRYTLRDVANDGRLNFDGLGVKSMSVSAYATTKEQAPLRHLRALRPTVANELGRELE